MTVELPFVSLRFCFSFFAVLTLTLLCGSETTALLCFLSALLHEGGHFAMMLVFHCPPKEVSFGAGGIVITRAPGILVSYRGEVWIALGGILVNLCSAALGAVLFLLTHAQIWRLFGWVNLILPALNLFPVYSLDAWTALCALLFARNEPVRAQRLLRRVSNGTTVVFVTAAVLYFCIISMNISLAAVCVYLIVLNARSD